MFKTMVFRLTTTMLILGILSACSMPSPSTVGSVTPQMTPSSVFTEAVETVVAQLTQVAASNPTEVPTQPPQPTSLPPASTPAQTKPTSAPTAVPPTASPVATQTLAPTTVSATQPVAPTSTTVASDPKLSLGSPTWVDNFENEKNWALGTDQVTSMEVKNGKLVMTAFTPNSHYGWALTWPNVTNFYLEFSATTQTCNGGDFYGVTFRAPDANRAYLLGFSCDGKYSFFIWNGQKQTRFINWTTNSAIVSGSNQTNRLGVKAVGNTFTFYANGIKLGEASDKTFDKGFFGVFIGSAKTANFTVKANFLQYWALP